MALLDFIGGGAGASGIGNMFHSFLHPEEGYEAAEEQEQKFYRDAQGNLRPYNQNGLSQFQRLNQQANALNNPVELENKWAQSYNQSPYAQQLTNKATEAGLGAASTQGLLGSSAALNNIQQSAGDIAQSDRQNYMNDLMQKYMASIGVGQNLYGIGANAAGQMSTNAINQGDTLSQLAYQKTNAPGDLFGKLAGTAANLGINYATGGLAGLGKAVTSQVAPQSQYRFGGANA